jgi:hypothetical protein
MNSHELECPKCKGTDQLDISATVWVRLTRDGTDADQSHDGSHTWGDDSPCYCGACGWTGTVLNAAPSRAAEDENPSIGTRDVCGLCGQDIEWTGDDWRDRGGNRGCCPYEKAGEIVTPPADAQHAPINADCAQGLHSWVDKTGMLARDTPCTHCGEPYGNPD